MVGVTIAQVTKTFGRSQALNRVSLAVHEGEFLTILGPSGSGKTTLLRLIAGLDTPDSGRIMMGERVVCAEAVWVSPQERGIGMVFQNYALWPHMTTFENVAFPLEVTGLPAIEIANRVREMLALVELTGLESKRPGELSGGEQQRAALARALVGRPSILLMDECLSNLDARLREKMAAELRRIQQTVGITTIYVTHDQHEALALSDRIAVLHQGGLQQVGTPDDLYHRPRNSLVAASLGPINLFSLAEACQLGLINGLFEPLDDSTTLGVRPEDVWVIPAQAYPAVAQWLKKTIHPADNVNGLLGRVTKVTFLGNVYRYQIELGKYVLQGQILPALLDVVGGHIDQMISGVSPGDRVSVVINPQTWIRFAEESSGSSDNRDYPEI